MSSVSSIGSSFSISALYSKLDTSGKGYFEVSDLETALSSLDSSSSNKEVTAASELFSQLDSDGDGKVTESELTTSLNKLAETLDNQFNMSRMEGAMPPPPPPEDDEEFTEDELNSQLEEIGSTDSARSTLISSIVENFDAADTNEDGKVSNAEAMAYAQANNITPASGSAASDSDSASSASSQASSQSTVSDAQVYRQLMDLMRAYGSDDTANTFAGTLSSLSALA